MSDTPLTQMPFGWWDTFNECFYRDVKSAGKADRGGNTLIALYESPPTQVNAADSAAHGNPGTGGLPARSEPSGWICANNSGTVHHYSKQDGWNLEIVTESPPTQEALDAITRTRMESATAEQQRPALGGDLDALVERLRQVQERIWAMCKEHRGPKMRIPAHSNDDDIFICDTMDQAADAITALRQLVEAAELRAATYQEHLDSEGLHLANEAVEDARRNDSIKAMKGGK